MMYFNTELINSILELGVNFHLCIAALSLKTKYRRDITLAVGDKAIMQCNTSSGRRPVWQYRANETVTPVSLDDKLRFSRISPVNDTDSGTYTMKLTNAQLNDSGWYECVEDNGKGPRGPRHVTVIKVAGW